MAAYPRPSAGSTVNREDLPDEVCGAACMMSIAEVLYQVRDSVSVSVGSEEIEPGDGWPYDKVMAALAADPTMKAQDLGVAIVTQYVASLYGNKLLRTVFLAIGVIFVVIFTTFLAAVLGPDP